VIILKKIFRVPFLESFATLPAMLKLSTQSDIATFRVLDLLQQVNALKASGEDIISLAPGQPSDGAPQEAIDYGIRVMKDGFLGYTEAIGMPLLRDRISVWYRDYYGIEVPMERIVITIGASGAFLFTFLSMFEPGDKIALAAPGYPAYRNMIKSCVLVPVEIETSMQTGYQPTIAHLEELEGVPDGLLIASPSNPAGTIIEPEELKALCAWCREKGVRLIADELYHGVTFGEKADSVLRYCKDVVAVQSFSKYFAMTGWRLGWMVLPENVTQRVKSLAESLFVAPPTLAQHVAYKTFDHTDVLDSYVARYEANLNVLLRELPKAGITKFPPTKGAFYLYADISDLTNNSEQWAKDLLQATGVAVTPGTDFDTKRGHQTIRLSFAGSTEEIEEASQRIKGFVKNEK
jgi:aspartate/methionine/tyrosine aminotransferase